MGAVRSDESSGDDAHREVLLALWAVPVAELGGVARHVLDATRRGIEGWRIIVVCPDGPLAARLEAQGTTVLRSPISPADGALAAIAALRRVLLREKPDLLHTHLAFADLVGVAAAAGLRSQHGGRIRVVSTEHGISGVRGLYQSSRARARAMSGAHRLRLLRTDRVIAVSESTREQVVAQWGGARRTRVVPNGVDTTSARDRAPACTEASTFGSPSADSEPSGDAEPVGPRVLTLSRLAPEKRIDAVLHAMPHVLAQQPDARLTIGGTGPQEAALRSLAARLGVENSVEMPGFLEPGAALERHDVVVQLSAWENLSYTLLDAVACGLGVVATDVGGNREIVPERCLVAADDPAEVARAILRQATRPSDRPRPEAPTDTAQMCARIGAVYREVIA